MLYLSRFSSVIYMYQRTFRTRKILFLFYLKYSKSEISKKIQNFRRTLSSKNQCNRKTKHTTDIKKVAEKCME